MAHPHTRQILVPEGRCDLRIDASRTSGHDRTCVSSKARDTLPVHWYCEHPSNLKKRAMSTPGGANERESKRQKTEAPEHLEV